MGNRKKKGKKKGKSHGEKANIRITGVRTIKHRFSEIILNRHKVAHPIKSIFKELMSFREKGVTYEELIPLISLFPKELFALRDEKQNDFLTQCISDRNCPVLLVRLIVQQMRAEQLKGIGENNPLAIIFGSPETELNFNDVEKIAFLLLDCYDENYLEKDSDLIAMAKAVCSATVVERIKRIMKVKLGAELECFSGYFRSKEFRTLLNMYEIEAMEIPMMPRELSNSLLEEEMLLVLGTDKRIPDYTESFGANCLPAFLVARAKALSTDQLEIFSGQFKSLVNTTKKSISEGKFSEADSALWEAAQGGHPLMFAPHVGRLLQILAPLIIKFGRPNIRIFELTMIKSMITTVLNACDHFTGKTLDLNLYYMHSGYLMLAKINDLEDKVEEGLENLKRIPKTSDSYDFALLWHAILYDKIQIDHPKVFEYLRMIKKDDTREKIDYNGFVGDMVLRGGKEIKVGKVRSGLKKWKFVQEINPKNFLKMIREHVPIRNFDMITDSPLCDTSEKIEVASIMINCCECFKLSPAWFYDARALINFQIDERAACSADLWYLIENPVGFDKEQRIKHCLMAVGCSACSPTALDKFLTIFKQCNIDFDVPAMRGSVLSCALMCLTEKRYEMAEYIMNKVTITSKGAKIHFAYPFERVVERCYDLMIEKKLHLALMTCDIGLAFHNVGKDRFVWHLIKAKIYRKQRNLDLSIEACKECLKQNPGCADAYFEMGMSQMIAEKLEEAAKSFTKCLDINPEHGNAKRALKKTTK